MLPFFSRFSKILNREDVMTKMELLEDDLLTKIILIVA
jgi:hypothetical protein